MLLFLEPSTSRPQGATPCHGVTHLGPTLVSRQSEVVLFGEGVSKEQLHLEGGSEKGLKIGGHFHGIVGPGTSH